VAVPAAAAVACATTAVATTERCRQEFRGLRSEGGRSENEILGRRSSSRAKQAASRERTATHFFSAESSACANRDERAARRTAGAVGWARPWVLKRVATAWNADTQSAMTAVGGRALWMAQM
jgi:hypothetical protein